MEENKRISNPLLGISLFIIYIPIVCFLLFIIGLSKVDAANYLTIYDVDNPSTSIINSYTNGSTYAYPGNIRRPALGVISDSFDFKQGYVYRLRVSFQISYEVPNNFSYSCESFGRSAILKENNRLGNTISTLTRLWQLNDCSIVSIGDNWLYEFDYSYDATFEATSTLASKDRISFMTGLNNPSVTGNWYVTYNVSGFNVFSLGSSDDTNTQNTIDAINSAIQSQIDNDNKNTQDIIDAITGGSLDDDTPVDDSGLNDFEDKENGLIDEDNLNYINNIDISLDNNTSTFFWDLFTRIINTNSLIYGLIISILSIGIIKLILNR